MYGNVVMDNEEEEIEEMTTEDREHGIIEKRITMKIMGSVN